MKSKGSNRPVKEVNKSNHARARTHKRAFTHFIDLTEDSPVSEKKTRSAVSSTAPVVPTPLVVPLIEDPVQRHTPLSSDEYASNLFRTAFLRAEANFVPRPDPRFKPFKPVVPISGHEIVRLLEPSLDRITWGLDRLIAQSEMLNACLVNGECREPEDPIFRFRALPEIPKKGEPAVKVEDVPDEFPETKADLLNLPKEQCDILLNYYGISFERESSVEFRRYLLARLFCIPQWTPPAEEECKIRRK